ncbi:UDP-glucose dehydrogenase family protein [Halovulum sp. GXIMD14793]
MQITMIGAGYVGLVSGVCFSDFGHNVVCVDKDPAKVDALNAGEVPIYEPGLEDMLRRNTSAGRLSFSTELPKAVAEADAVFIAVGTPSRRGDGHADLSYVYAAAAEIAHHLDGFTVVVTKSTVPAGTNAEVARIIAETNPDADVEVASNPEFLREGEAIDDFMDPDRIVIGINSDRAKSVMEAIYGPLLQREAPIVFCDPVSAELSKYAANAFLATKITFINEMAALCEATGADVTAVAKAMGMDDRIGARFLKPGPGYGGSCFPKDTRALARIGQDFGRPQTLVETVISVNEEIKRRMIDKIMELCDDSVNGKQITVLGVTFKPETDDMRESPSLTIVPFLVGNGARVHVVDPQGRHAGEALLPGVEWMEDPYEASKESDAIVVLTEWNEFRGLDLQRLADVMRTPRLADLRNIYSSTAARDAGFDYIGIGRGLRKDIAIGGVKPALKAVSDS